MTTVKVQLNKFRVLHDGTYPLVFQIIHRRRKRVIYSPYHLHEETFDANHTRAVNRRSRRVSNLQEINAYIDTTLQDIKQVIGWFEGQSGDYSVSDIVELYRSGQDKSFVVPYLHNFISPFRKIHIGTVRTAKRAVSKECIIQIAQERELNDKRLDLTRDLFLFSFYSRGMPFVDMAFLRHSDITGDTIRYSRRKTGQPLSVKMTAPLRELIDKYSNGGEYVLPILTSGSKTLYGQYQNALRRHNRQLSSLSSELKLPCRLTSYVARHSWATIAHNSGVPVSVISEGLGHGSEKITYTYLAALEPSVLNAANERVTALCTGIHQNKRTIKN
jgi:integrase